MERETAKIIAEQIIDTQPWDTADDRELALNCMVEGMTLDDNEEEHVKFEAALRHVLKDTIDPGEIRRWFEHGGWRVTRTERVD